MSCSLLKTVLIGVSLTLALFSVTASDLVVAEKGKVIPLIVNVSSNEGGKLAASELRTYLQKISGVASLGKDPKASGISRVFQIVLADASSKEKGFKIPVEIGKKLSSSPKKDSFYIKTLNLHTLLIAGKTPRALLYGACFFLEHYLGVRWFYPGEQGEHVPRIAVVKIPAIDDFQEPFTDWRIAAYTGHDRKDVPWTREDPYLWQYRNLGIPLAWRSRKHPELKSISLNELPGGHVCFDRAIPNTLYEEHPEYFPLLDGKRVKCSCRKKNQVGSDGKPLPWVQRCVSNPEVKKRMVDYIIGQFDACPNGSFGMGAADVPHAWCQCPECIKMGTLNGIYSDSNLYYGFYKAVSDEVLKKHPNANLWCYIYLDYRDLPTDPKLKFDKRVNAIYYAHGRCIAHPINDPKCEINKPFYKDYAAWSRFFNRVGLCDYYGNSNTPYCPHEYNFAADAPVRIKHNDWGEREHITAERYFYNWPFYYAKMKLWWNPKLDINKLMDDVWTKYYGVAAEPMKKFHALRRSLWGNAPGHAWYPGPQRGAYCLALPESEKALKSYLDEAVELAKNDKLLLARLDMERRALEETWVAQAVKIRQQLAAKRIIPTKMTEGPIKIDGKLSEPGWKKVEAVDRFISPYTKNELRERTIVRTLYDKDNWYISVECMNDKAWMPLKAKYKQRNDGRIAAEDDSVEVFLCTPGDGIYYQFMVNSLGAYCDIKLKDKTFDSKCEVAASVLPDRYIVEMRIPVKALGIPEIKSGQNWRLNVWRNIRNLQAPETVDRGGIDGARPHSDVSFYRPLMPAGWEVIQNDSFQNLNKKGLPATWRITTPAHFSMGKKDAKSFVKLRACKIYQPMNLSKTGRQRAKRMLEPCRITVIILASGKGKLELIPSTGFKPRIHKARKTMTADLTDKIKEYTFHFDMAKDEWGYIYIGASNADIYNVSAIKTVK